VTSDVLAHVDAVFGDDVEAWHEALTSRLPAIVDQWELQLGEAMVGGWNSVVLACHGPRGAAVLKLTLRPEAVHLEGQALEHWGPGAAAEVRGVDATRGALLLERLVPGTSLDPRSCAIDSVARALVRLYRAGPAQPGLPTLAGRYADADERLLRMWRRSRNGIERDTAERAARELRALSAAPVDGGAVLLHGDPVPANFLLGAHGHRAIDPRPMVGDPAYDAAFWALFAEEGSDVLPKADQLAAALGLDRVLVVRWAAAMAVDRLLQVAGSPPHAALAERLARFIRSQTAGTA